MKKIISLVILIVFCLTPVVILSGCNKNDIWITAYQNVTEFTEKTENNYIDFYAEQHINIQYNQELTNAIETYESYKDLKDVYAFSLEHSLNTLKYTNSFQFEPVYLDNSKKEIKNSFENFNKTFDSFKKQVEIFNKDHNYFNEKITNEFENDFSNQKLKDYKISYYNLILKAIDLSQATLDVYMTSYQNINLIDNNIPVGNEELANNIILLNFVKVYVETELTAFGGIAEQNAVSDDIKNIIIDLNSNKKDLNKPTDDVAIANYNIWLNQYEFFTNEFDKFFLCLENFSLKEFKNSYNSDENTFLTENPDQEVYYNTYKNAKNSIFAHIQQKTNALFA